MDQPTGVTPFELAETGRAKGERRITTGYATYQLVTVLQECDMMIDQYKVTTQLYQEGKATKEEVEADLLVATEALKEKKTVEAALDKVAQMAEQLGMVE